MYDTVKVQREMAKALNVPETEHTHGDLMLTVKAQELGIGINSKLDGGNG
jgi:hypothetical protein